MTNIKHCYICAHTSIGFISFLPDWIREAKQVFILHGSSYKLKSAFLKKLGEQLHTLGLPIAYLHSLQDANELEGLIVPAHSVIVIDGNTDHTFSLTRPGIRDTIVDFSEAYVSHKMQIFQKDVQQWEKQKNELKKEMYRHFSLAKETHEQKEKIYISAMDMEKANAIAKELITKIFHTQKEREVATERKFFLGASTAEGAINFIEQITETCQKRYIIKGRAGSGKSTLMRKIAQAALEQGTSVEYYHCSFDPKSLDMIVLPAYRIAILDGTSPHVIDPSRESDEIIDMFKLAIDPAVENAYQQQLEELQSIYRTHIDEAIAVLRKLKTIDEEFNRRYVEGIDMHQLMQLEQKWLCQILRFVGVNA